ncbi:MAG: hypothetical protein ACLU77_15130 [Waltera sp.]
MVLSVLPENVRDRCRNDQDYYQQISNQTDKYFGILLRLALLQDSIFTLFQSEAPPARAVVSPVLSPDIFPEFFTEIFQMFLRAHTQILLCK